jgi:hypothetical protein
MRSTPEHVAEPEPEPEPEPVAETVPEPVAESKPIFADEAPEPAPFVAGPAEDDVIDPIATMAAATEATIALETPTKGRNRAALDDVATVPESRRVQARARREQAKQSKAEKAAARAEKRSSRSRKQPADLLVEKMPVIKPVYAAILTGLISGLITVLLAKGASAGCEAVRSNDNCGGGIGLLALVAILAIEVLIGANLLKAFRVSDPFSTSFLGVGVVAIFAMLVFLDSLNKVQMIGIIPGLTAVSFLMSWWVTVRFIEE